jgi:hypothetical protein
MTDLAIRAMDAHGGLERWRQLKTISARLLQGGVLWKLKGQEGVLDDVHVTVDLRQEWASHRPFGQPDRRSSFQPDRVAIETSNGDVVEERANPRESFRGHKFDTPWDSLQLAYFAGYAMWTYMNTPFLFALPGVETEELESWQENGEAWRRLKVTFPERIATHSTEQTFYFDRQGLLSDMTIKSTWPEVLQLHITCQRSQTCQESSCQPNTRSFHVSLTEARHRRRSSCRSTSAKSNSSRSHDSLGDRSNETRRERSFHNEEIVRHLYAVAEEKPMECLDSVGATGD